MPEQYDQPLPRLERFDPGSTGPETLDSPTGRGHPSGWPGPEAGGHPGPAGGLISDQGRAFESNRSSSRAGGEAGSRPGPVVRVRAGAGRPLLNWREVGLYSDLLVTLAWRDVRVRYKQTVLGVLWVVLQPLIAALIFTFVFGLVARMPSEGLPYMLVAYSGLIAWNAFAGVLQRSSSALVSNAHLVTKVYFPGRSCRSRRSSRP